MELEKQVCSVNLANKLRELGVKQQSIFWHWATDVEEDGLTWWSVSEKEPRRGKKVRELSTPHHFRGKLSAFTVAELGEMLPNYFKHEQRGYVNLVMMRLDDGRSEVMYREFTDVAFVERANTEADARAKMLVYLLENKLIELDRCANQRAIKQPTASPVTP